MSMPAPCSTAEDFGSCSTAKLLELAQALPKSSPILPLVLQALKARGVVL